MLNTFLLVDCDHCGHQFDRLVLSLSPSQHAEAMSTLEDLIQQDGWHVFRNRYRCPDCNLELAWLQSSTSTNTNLSPEQIF